MFRAKCGEDFHIDYSSLPTDGKVLAWVRAGLSVAALAVLGAGCALPQEVSRTPRSAIEQLLLTQAVAQSIADLTVPLPEGVTVAVSGLQTDRAHMHMSEEDASFGVIDSPSWDLAYVRDAVSARLGELGYLVKKAADESDFLIRVNVESRGPYLGHGAQRQGQNPVARNQKPLRRYTAHDSVA